MQVYRSTCRTHQKPPRLSADFKRAFSGGPECAQFTYLGTACLSVGAGAGPLQPKGAPEAQDIARKILPTMVSHSELRKLFYSADAVCFDVDSTVIREEGIDELAKICGVEDAVSEMELVSRLQERNVQVFLISGGFRSIVEHVASKLNIPGTNIFANRLKFYFNGEYAGFDETQPTAESGGKGKVIKLLKEKFHFKKIIMIGDGATDMEACPPADAFIGFGGNVIRQQVKDNAKWYITDFVELVGELEE
ncbi:phosphoserine phosphatase isoform X3 [Trachypithecus francoisi]|uniref:phosphoserine phosphatase isoform X3 n=1 Tax=Trachypithecus francoisi TaxID=54180 RepID=UPI00141ACD18|nr:phosphoserine phosphatase isoform X3 [Trachypithecus francoisi]